MKYVLDGPLDAHLCFNPHSTAEAALTASANTGESETFQAVAMYWIQIE